VRIGEGSLTPVDGVSEVDIVRLGGISNVNSVSGIFVVNANFDNFLI